MSHQAARPAGSVFLAGMLWQDFSEVAGGKGVLTAVYVFAGALLEGLGLSLLIPLFGLIFGSGAMPGPLGRAVSVLFAFCGVSTPFARLVLLLSVFGMAMVLRAIVMAARDVAILELQLGFVEIQRLSIARSLAAARWDYIARLRHARIAHFMSGEIQRLGVGVNFLLRVAVGAVMVLVQCALAFFLAPLLALFLLVLLVAGAFLLGPVLGRARSLGGHVTETNLALLDNTTQFLGGLKLAMSQNLETGFVEEARESLRQMTRRQIGHAKAQSRGQAALFSIAAVTGAGLVLAGFGWFHVAPAVLVTLLLIVTRMIGPVGQIRQGVEQLAQVLAVYESLRNLKGELTLAARVEARAVTPAPQGVIRFEKVSFRHGDSDGLRALSLAIAPGEFVGITGLSGVGKTTFADLLVGLYPPQTGSIFVGGAPLNDAALTSWRDRLSYVLQDPFLFHDTIRRNLAWANHRADEEQMWKALALAGAGDLVGRVENGLDTMVGERGALVSGGERQRIALARALFRDPELLVLDEATGAIDREGEREIFRRLKTMSQRPTIVLIAHRTENLDLCDRVLRFETAGGISCAIAAA